MIIQAWLVWLLPLLSAPVVPIVSFINEKSCKWFAVVVSGLTTVVGFYQALVFRGPSSETLLDWVGLGIHLPLEVEVDGLSVLIAAFVAFLSFVIIVYASEHMKREKGQARFYSLVLLFVGSMLGLVMAGNLIQLYFFWEIVGICSALLIAFWFEKESARKAGFKAFIVTRFGDISLLIAVILILSTIDSTNFDAITSAVQSQGANGTWFLVGIMILIGAMGKSAQVPLHVWLPDAMEGPTPVSALIHAATMVNAGVFLLVRTFPIFDASPLLLSTVLFIGLLSFIIGAACASAAEDLKRILAYSTISQLGLMFVAIGLGNWWGAIYLLVSQGLFKALAFMAAGYAIEATGTRDIEEMGGLRHTMKYTYFAFLFSMLAMVGIPPLIGFWTKEVILSAAFTTNLGAFLIIAAASALTSFYSFRATIKVFHGAPRSTETKEAPLLIVLPMMVLVSSLIFGWLVLAHQSILLPSLSIEPGLVTSTVTMVVAFVGLVVTYLAFVSRAEATKRLVQTNVPFQVIRKLLLSGFGFDRFYTFAVKRIVGPLVRVATAIQTGILGNNIALLLSALIVIILLIVARVI